MVRGRGTAAKLRQAARAQREGDTWWLVAHIVANESKSCFCIRAKLASDTTSRAFIGPGAWNLKAQKYHLCTLHASSHAEVAFTTAASSVVASPKPQPFRRGEKRSSQGMGKRSLSTSLSTEEDGRLFVSMESRVTPSVGMPMVLLAA